ncbi:hypothetical protein R5R35_005474 [Gryllus longicercus]|uniref:Replication protein A C-terminal domain-containing protein n=1 Tax=Gryllus longicercus TaxID=2509291 RepID=A0AAN9VT29_9ORTH
MWGDGGNFGGGGFLDNSFASPSAETTEKKQNRRGENIVPVTINQILKSGEDFKIGELDVHVVSLVGIIKNVDMSSTKITYLIEDTTGQIEAVQWLEGPLEGSQPSENTYCRVSGTVRVTQGKRCIMVFNILPITDLNDLTVHLLEVIDVHQCAPNFSELQNMGAQAASKTAMNYPLGNSMMNMNQMDDGLDQHAPSDPQQRIVFKVISDAAVDDEGGVDVQFITRKLNGQMNESTVRTITEFLLHEGFVFSTIDDEHFTVTR